MHHLALREALPAPQPSPPWASFERRQLCPRRPSHRDDSGPFSGTCPFLRLSPTPSPNLALLLLSLQDIIWACPPAPSLSPPRHPWLFFQHSLTLAAGDFRSWKSQGPAGWGRDPSILTPSRPPIRLGLGILREGDFSDPCPTRLPPGPASSHRTSHHGPSLQGTLITLAARELPQHYAGSSLSQHRACIQKCGKNE